MSKQYITFDLYNNTMLGTLPIFQELEFEIDEVRFDEVEGAFEIER
jgi:hypothetical protein